MKPVIIVIAACLASSALAQQPAQVPATAAPQENAAPSPLPHPAIAPPVLNSPFGEDEELKAIERAKEEARLKMQQDALVAAKAKEDARKMAIQVAMVPVKVLARGKQGDRSVVLLAMDGSRRILLALNETMPLNTTAGAVEMTLINVTRQTLTFALDDGTVLSLQ